MTSTFNNKKSLKKLTSKMLFSNRTNTERFTNKKIQDYSKKQVQTKYVQKKVVSWLHRCNKTLYLNFTYLFTFLFP